MDQMTQQNSALVEESTAAARALSNEAIKLGELMAFFKLKSAPASGDRRRLPSHQPKVIKSSPSVAKAAPASAMIDDGGWSEF